MSPDSVRALEASEVASYREHGWVKLDRLISPDLARDLLARAKKLMGEKGGEHQLRAGQDFGTPFFYDYHDIAADDELYHALASDKRLGHNVQRLMGRDVAVKRFADMLAVKLPQGARGGRGDGDTVYHQDGPRLPYDRVGNVNIWIALDEVTPDMGSMRFYSGSHRLGPLGRVWPEGKKLLDVYPDIAKELTLSPELYLMPGDATMHHSLCIHGAPANSTNRPRWAYILQLFPADAVFTETVLPFVARLGLQTDKPFDHPRFPQVYP